MASDRQFTHPTLLLLLLLSHRALSATAPPKPKVQIQTQIAPLRPNTNPAVPPKRIATVSDAVLKAEYNKAKNSKCVKKNPHRIAHELARLRAESLQRLKRSGQQFLGVDLRVLKDVPPPAS